MTAKDYILLFAKGMGMGAANVIPGVSGGTIAFVTGIYEQLIDSIKAFDLEAAKKLLRFDLKAFSEQVNLAFLAAVFAGIAVSILSLARLLEYLFESQPVPTWAFFFGLILATVYLVSKEIKPLNLSAIAMNLLGVAIVVGLYFVNTGAANDNFFWLMLCGVVAVCSMILPGLSGSFVLLIMGNYELILGAASDLNFQILLPVMLGAAIGLPAFANLLSWVFKKFRNGTLSFINGLVLGSLYVIWPWKEAIYQTVRGKEKVIGYLHQLPEAYDAGFFLAIGCIIAGAVIVLVLDRMGANKPAGK